MIQTGEDQPWIAACLLTDASGLCAHCFFTPCIVTMFLPQRSTHREDLRSEGITPRPREPLRHTGPHHSRRGHLRGSCYIAAHTRVLPCAIPQEPLLVARLVTCRRCDTRCRLRPRGTVGARLLRTARMACARPDRIGSHPKSKLLGATYRIQGNTLHLVSLMSLTVRLAPSGHDTSERLTTPYSGGLPACAVPSQRATIARSPRSFPVPLVLLTQASRGSC